MKGSRRVYRCSNCGGPGHQARACTKPAGTYAKAPADRLPSLVGPEALRAMLPEVIAIEAVLMGPEAIQTAILKCIDAEDAAPVGRSLSNAWRELLARARKVPIEAIGVAIRKRKALDKAEREYQAAIAPIRVIVWPASVSSESTVTPDSDGSDDAPGSGDLTPELQKP